MSYGVVWSKNSIEFLNKIEPLIAKRIIKYVGEFSENPRTKEFKKLKGEQAFRLRVGDYRIIFDFNQEEKRISVLKIGHRKNIYD